MKTLIFGCASVLAAATLAAAFLAGCSDTAPVGPAPVSASRSNLFLLNGPDDPRVHIETEPGAEIPTGSEATLFQYPLDSPPAEVKEWTSPVVYWNEMTTSLCTAAKFPPPAFSRAYTLVHTAIFDALAVTGHGRRNDLIGRVVAAGAASRVLEYLFPGEITGIEEALGSQMYADHGKALGRVRRSAAVGFAVGAVAVAHGMEDGSNVQYSGTSPSGPGIWTGSNPVLPMCGQWTTWIVASGAAIQPEAPYAYGSPADLADVESVYQASFNRTPGQVAIVHKWADVSPPAIWNGILNERIVAGRMDELDAARAHAYLNCAMYDAFVSCWYTKYEYWVARPSMRLAGRTPAFTTVIPTPNFPTYTSGHSTISAAAAVVLGEVFPAEQAWFTAQAAEAAMSRFYGGIHFSHDNDQGLLAGRLIGERVVERMRYGQIPYAAAP
jgi:hypothetical protein